MSSLYILLNQNLIYFDPLIHCITLDYSTFESVEKFPRCDTADEISSAVVYFSAVLFITPVQGF